MPPDGAGASAIRGLGLGQWRLRPGPRIEIAGPHGVHESFACQATKDAVGGRMCRIKVVKDVKVFVPVSACDGLDHVAPGRLRHHHLPDARLGQNPCPGRAGRGPRASSRTGPSDGTPDARRLRQFQKPGALRGEVRRQDKGDRPGLCRLVLRRRHERPALGYVVVELHAMVPEQVLIEIRTCCLQLVSHPAALKKL